MAFHPISHPGELFLGVLQEMVGCAVRFKRRIILILFIDEEAPRLGTVAAVL